MKVIVPNTRVILTSLVVLILLASSWMYWGIGFKTLFPETYEIFYSVVQGVPITHNIEAPDLPLNVLIDKYTIAKAWVCNDSDISTEALSKISCHHKI